MGSADEGIEVVSVDSEEEGAVWLWACASTGRRRSVDESRMSTALLGKDKGRFDIWRTKRLAEVGWLRGMVDAKET